MDEIIIQDLEVWYRVGVPEEERAEVQRLLLTLKLSLDFRKAVGSDALADTVDYDALCRGLDSFGESRQWRLIETLASDVAEWVLGHYPVEKVSVGIKKFVIPQARWVGVQLERGQAG